MWAQDLAQGRKAEFDALKQKLDAALAPTKDDEKESNQVGEIRALKEQLTTAETIKKQLMAKMEEAAAAGADLDARNGFLTEQIQTERDAQLKEVLTLTEELTQAQQGQRCAREETAEQKHLVEVADRENKRLEQELGEALALSTFDAGTGDVVKQAVVKEQQFTIQATKVDSCSWQNEKLFTFRKMEDNKPTFYMEGTEGQWGTGRKTLKRVKVTGLTEDKVTNEYVMELSAIGQGWAKNRRIPKDDESKKLVAYLETRHIIVRAARRRMLNTPMERLMGTIRN